MNLRRRNAGSLVTLGDQIGEGGEAWIYRVAGEARMVAKIYKRPTSGHQTKLQAMLQNRPRDPAMEEHKAVSIAWPEDLLEVRHAGRPATFKGFLMPAAHGSVKLHEVILPKSRRRVMPGFCHWYLHYTARNIAGIFSALHKAGYVVGDINEGNIIVADTSLLTIVDTDSFQVRDGATGTVFRCPVGVPECTPPELQNLPGGFASVDRSVEHDLFGMTLAIFRLLMEGTHPFAGVSQSMKEPTEPALRIASGLFPYDPANRNRCRPAPLAPKFDSLHPKLQQMFITCFGTGHRWPNLRPSALAWREALDEAIKALVRCAANEAHIYGSHNAECPWCLRQRGGAGSRGIQPRRPASVLPGAQTAPARPSDPGRKPAPVKTTKRKAVSPAGRSRRKKLAWIGVALVNLTLTGWIIWIFDPGNWRNPSAKPSVGNIAGTTDPRPTHERAADSKSVRPDATRGGAARIEPMAVVTPARQPLRHDNAVRFAAFSPDGQRLLTISGDYTVRVWDTATGNSVGQPLLHDSTVWSASFSPDSSLLVTASGLRARVWETATGRPLGSPIKHDSFVWSAAFKGNNRLIITASNTAFTVWEAGTGRPIRQADKRYSDARFAAFNSNTNSIVIVNDSQAVVWDTSTGKPTGQPLVHSRSIRFAAFSTDGNHVVTASEDGTARAWDAISGTPAGAVLKHSASVVGAAFSPDGTMVVTASEDRTARVWELGTGKPVGEPLKHDGWVNSAVFSQDGRWIVTASSDRTARMWPAPQPR